VVASQILFSLLFNGDMEPATGTRQMKICMVIDNAHTYVNSYKYGRSMNNFLSYYTNLMKSVSVLVVTMEINTD